MPVYVSTYCITGDTGTDVIDGLARTGNKNIELGSRAVFKNTRPSEIVRPDVNFLAHNYFIKPDKPFVLNLASQNKEILKQSREYILKAIDFCHSAGIPLLTIHAGFRTDPDVNLKFDKNTAIPSYDKSFDTFIKTIKIINAYAEQKKVKIGIENNVLEASNLVDRKNQLLLLCEADEFDELWNRVNSDNIGTLLDLGHLKVTAHTLGFDRYQFVERVKNKVFALHVHDNNEMIDQHKALDKTSWCLDIIRQKPFNSLPIVLESMGLSLIEAVGQIKLIEGVLQKEHKGN